MTTQIEALRECPFCGHHAYEPRKVHGEAWGSYDWEIRCSSSHCCARVRIVADGWERNLDAESNKHIPADQLHDDRLLQLRRMWNRRVSSSAGEAGPVAWMSPARFNEDDDGGLDKESVSYACRLANLLGGGDYPEPMTLTNGHAGLYWNSDEWYADLEFFPEGKVTYYMESRASLGKFKGAVQFDGKTIPDVFKPLYAHPTPEKPAEGSQTIVLCYAGLRISNPKDWVGKPPMEGIEEMYLGVYPGATGQAAVDWADKNVATLPTAQATPK